MNMTDNKLRDAFLTDKMSRYLFRKYAPRNLNDQALADEMASLVRCLMRHAPMACYDDWWWSFEDRLEEAAKTRAWPTAWEIRHAAKTPSFRPSQRAGNGWQIDERVVNANRIIAGDSVPEHSLYGPFAVELLRSGKVSQDQMNRCRSVLFSQLSETYGKTEARVKLARLEARHAAAESSLREPSKPRDLPKPRPKMVTLRKDEKIA